MKKQEEFENLTIDSVGIITQWQNDVDTGTVHYWQTISHANDESVVTQLKTIYQFLLEHQDQPFLPKLDEKKTQIHDRIIHYFLPSGNTLELFRQQKKPNHDQIKFIRDQLISIYSFLTENKNFEFSYYPVGLLIDQQGKVWITALTLSEVKTNFTHQIISEFYSGKNENRSSWVSVQTFFLEDNILNIITDLMTLLGDKHINQFPLLSFIEKNVLDPLLKISHCQDELIELLLAVLHISGQIGQNSLREEIIQFVERLKPSELSSAQLTRYKIEKVSYYFDTANFKMGSDCLESMSLKELNYFPSSTAAYYLLLGKLSSHHGDVRQSLLFTETALSFVDKKDLHTQLDIYFHRYRIYSVHLNSVEQAYQELQQAMPIMEELSDPLKEGIFFNALALHYYDQYDQENAFEYAFRAEKQLKDFGGWQPYSITLGLLGIIYLRAGDYELAVKWLEKSKNLRLQFGDSIGALRAESNIAVTYILLGLFDEAKEKFLSIFSERTKLVDKFGMAYSLLNLGRVQFYSSHEDGMTDYFQQAYHLAKEIKNEELEWLIVAFLLRSTHELQYEFILRKVELPRKHKFSVMVLLARIENFTLRKSKDGLSELIDQAISYFDEMKSLDSFEQEFYFILSEALALLGRSQESVEMLRSAQFDLQKKANRISDKSLVDIFVNEIPINNEIQNKCEEKLAQYNDEEAIMVNLIFTLTNLKYEQDDEIYFQTITERVSSYFGNSTCYVFLKQDNDIDLTVFCNNKNENPDSFILCRKHVHQVLSRPDNMRTPWLDTYDENSDTYKMIIVPFMINQKLKGALVVYSPNYPLLEKNVQMLGVLSTIIENTLEKSRRLASNQENEYNPSNDILTSKKSKPNTMSGHSLVMQNVYKLIDAASKSEAPVLISGESGTGKEVVAKAIHAQSGRKKFPFIPLDCGATSENLLESELFGYKKGSFTGAMDDKVGLFEAATKGVLFLDEITNTSLSFQARLLRVLQEGEIRRIGETVYRKIGTRIISATNLDIEKLIEEQKFRHDLFYRLNVIRIEIPPLRNRKDDIPIIVHDYLQKKVSPDDKRLQISKDVMTILLDYSWPGNVRELINELEKVLVLTTSHYPISVDDLSAKLVKSTYHETKEDDSAQASSSLLDKAKEIGLKQLVESLEADLIRQEIRNQNGKLINIAKSLKLANATLSDKMKKYGLSI